MSLRKTGLSVVAVAERLVVEIDVDAAGERIRDDQRRRREVVRPHLGMNAALEVAVAGQHGRDDQLAARSIASEIVVGQRTAVADARRAAVADEVEAEACSSGSDQTRRRSR